MDANKLLLALDDSAVWVSARVAETVGKELVQRGMLVHDGSLGSCGEATTQHLYRLTPLGREYVQKLRQVTESPTETLLDKIYALLRPKLMPMSRGSTEALCLQIIEECANAGKTEL